MFLDLPVDCQAIVFEKLEVHDRLRLNTALAKSKINATINTTAKDDKTLLAICKILRKPTAKRPIARKIIAFMQVHVEDPTVTRLCHDHDIVLPSTRMGPSHEEIILDLTHRIESDTLCPDFLEMLVSHCSQDRDDPHIATTTLALETLSRIATVSQLDHVIVYHSVFRDEFNAHIKDCLYIAVNYGRHDVAKFMIRDAESRAAPLDLTDVTLLGHQARCGRAFMWTHVPFDESERGRILSALEDDLDTDGMIHFHQAFVN